MPGEQLSISPTTTLPAKFTPSLATLVKSGKTLGEIMEVLNVDEKEARSRLTATGMLEKVIGHVAGSPPAVVTPLAPRPLTEQIVENTQKGNAEVAAAAEAIEKKHDALAALIGKKFRSISHDTTVNGFDVEVKEVDGLIARVEWVNGPGDGGSFKVAAVQLLEQFEEVVDGAVRTPAENPAFKPRGRKPRAVAAAPATPAAPPPQSAPPTATDVPLGNAVSPTVGTSTPVVLPENTPEHITITMETHVRLPAVELTDATAMALGRLAAIGMNSNVPVTKILEWARVVLDAQTKTTVHTWTKP